MRFSFAHISNNKPLLAGLAGAAAAAVIGTTVGYASLTSEVTLSVDGKPQQIRVMGGTVADVLADQGLEVSERDLVAPGLEHSVQDGTHIAVNYARPVDLTVDGTNSTHWVTATSVDGALAEIGRRFESANLSVSRSLTIGRRGIDVDVVTPKNLSVTVGAKKARKVELAAGTVADALGELDVTLDSDDEVTPAPETQLSDGDKIVVTRVRTETRSVKGETIAFATTRQDDDSLAKGETSTVTAGVNGARDVTYRVTYRNGKQTAKTVVTADVRKKPVKAVVKVGTRVDPTTNFAGGNTVWDALAKCESGGNWATNTGNGYYGGLQFSAATWRSVGGTGLPSQHSREEQIRRGKILQARAGWGQWPACTSRLGLR